MTALALAVCLAQADPLEGVAPGDAVRIELKNGNTLRGRVLRLDVERGCLLLDVSDQFPDIEGTMCLERRTIASIAPAKAPSPEAAEAARVAAAERLRRDEETRRERQSAEREARRQFEIEFEAAAAERDRQEEARRRDELGRRLHARDMYELYSEARGWGPRAYDRIGERLARGGWPPTRAEMEFHAGYEDWLAGRDLYYSEFGGPPSRLGVICAGGAVITYVREVPFAVEWRTDRWVVVP